jgi:hypothetical protein
LTPISYEVDEYKVVVLQSIDQVSEGANNEGQAVSDAMSDAAVVSDANNDVTAVSSMRHLMPVTRARNRRSRVKRWPKSLVLVVPVDRKDPKAIRLYIDLTILTARSAWEHREFIMARSFFKSAIDTLFEQGQQDRAVNLIDEMDEVRNQHEKHDSAKRIYERYPNAIQLKLDQAFSDLDLSQAINLLRQGVAIAKAAHDKKGVIIYKKQLASVELVHEGKGARRVLINNIMRAKLVDSLKLATVRVQLSFQLTYQEQTVILAPFCVLVE